MFAGDIVIETDRGAYWLTSIAVDTADRTEEFFLYLERTEVGTPETERMFNPPRQVIEHFPDNLQLSRLIGQRPRSMSFLRESASAHDTPTGLLIEHEGTQFLFWADDVLPASLALSSDPSVVSRELGPRVRTEVRKLESI